jgi:UDP-N-acetylmuramate dehydrogenase
MKDTIYRRLTGILKGMVLSGEPLWRHTSIRIGGTALVWVEPEDLQDAARVIEFSRQGSLPLVTIGAGTKLLAPDDGFDGIVVRMNSPCFKTIEIEDETITAGSGVLISDMLKTAVMNGLGGCEFLAGIPGTVGGALVMNAGICRENNLQSIGDIVESVTVMDMNGQVLTINSDSAGFGYRTSDLSRYLVVGAKLRLKERDRRTTQGHIERFLEYRRAVQAVSEPNAGCIFKNPGDFPMTAGQLIDLAGLKGTRINDAMVSIQHANFIVNDGNATAKDVMLLIDLVRARVSEYHNVALDMELRILRNDTLFR